MGLLESNFDKELSYGQPDGSPILALSFFSVCLKIRKNVLLPNLHFFLFSGPPRSMPNADQNPGIDPNVDQFRSIPINADQCIY